VIIRDQHGDEMAFVDVDGDVCFEGKAAGVTTYYYAPREARRIAAEIIACADRIEGVVAVDASGLEKHYEPSPRSNAADLATLAKAIAYLPNDIRGPLNALLATRIGEVLG